jgi:hypothetical protein
MTLKLGLIDLIIIIKKTNKAAMAAVDFNPINFQQVNTVLGHHNSDILLLPLLIFLAVMNR